MTGIKINSSQELTVKTTEGRAFIMVGPESQTAFTQVDRFVHLIDLQIAPSLTDHLAKLEKLWANE